MSTKTFVIEEARRSAGLLGHRDVRERRLIYAHVLNRGRGAQVVKAGASATVTINTIR